jgi:[ribosomal protein S18]-alanine N-acetyltransferase
MSKPRFATESIYINIDKMVEHDLLYVVEIEESCGLSKWGWDAYYSEINRGSVMLVAREVYRYPQSEPEVVGFVAAHLAVDEMHINNIAVRPQYRRYGIGGALLKSALETGMDLGATSAVLEVRASNDSAQMLYRKYDFSIIGRRPQYYTSPVEDALVMKTVLRSVKA